VSSIVPGRLRSVRITGRNVPDAPATRIGQPRPSSKGAVAAHGQQRIIWPPSCRWPSSFLVLLMPKTAAGGPDQPAASRRRRPRPAVPGQADGQAAHRRPAEAPAPPVAPSWPARP
jgi:hypothetical protein